MAQQQPQQSTTQQQYQQFPQNYYPDQYQQQYQQLLNGNSSNSQQAAQLQAASQVNQPYGSYYMQSNTQQAGQPQAQSQQAGQQPNPQQQIAGQPQTQQAASTGSTTQVAAGGDQYAHARYPAGYAAPYNSYSIYQQSVPQNQLSQPQPQHYNQSNSGSGSTAASAAYSTGNTSTNTPIQADTLNSASNSSVGQYQPPGIRPRVTTTMWEDEKTLCYQVDANNVSVVRRADNNMINGTKLLNVAQMTRGRRDGILKSEKVRHVVKIGSMHLKGVWIPFERALAMAQREGIVDLLYPLFVRDIKRVIQTGVTPNSNANVVGGAKQASHLSGATGSAGQQQGSAGSTNNNLSSYYQQYSSQYPQANGGASTQTNQSPLHVNSSISGNQDSSAVPQPQPQQQQSPQQQQQQSQVYGYQQPYYATAPNQYYQPYGPNANYSSYGGQPVYPGYGYVNQGQVPQSVPQSVQSSANQGSKAGRPQGTGSSGSQPELSGNSTDATSTAGDVKRDGLIKK